jgi:pyroglutamyl-peptidase
MVHVGMAAGRSYYSVERLGHRAGYEVGDVDGVTLGDESGVGEGGGASGEREGVEGGEGQGEQEEDKSIGENNGIEKEKWIWEGCPESLETSLDIGDVWARWRNALPVRWSIRSMLNEIEYSDERLQC